MSAALLGSPWERYVDLAPADLDALDDPAGVRAKVGPEVRGSGTQGSMGHFCYFNMDGGAHADYTHHFDWAVNGDFTIVINALAGNLPNGTTIDVSVQGSVAGADGTWIDLHTDVIDGVSIDDTIATAVYDYDSKGRLPFMRLELSASSASDETILLAVYPH